jgi:twinkle protein
MNLLPIEPRALRTRGLTLDTCRKFSYGVGEDSSGPYQAATYHNSKGTPAAQKVRRNGKTFSVIGDFKTTGLFGQHLWREGGKRVIITEGEIDCMSACQVLGLTWPVVSLPTGAAGAKKALSKALTWLDGYDEVILCFDQDEAGREAVEACAPLFKPGKLKIVALPRKDANEMLVAREVKLLSNSLWEAKTWRPDGIIHGTALWQELIRDDICKSIPWPWDGLNEKLQGLRTGELVTITAGTGTGKSAFVREVTHHLLKSGENVGYLGLEEPVKRSALGVLGIELNKPLAQDPFAVSEETMKEAFNSIMERAVFLDHWGSLVSSQLLCQIRYMAVGMSCRWIVLDHISIVVSSQEEVTSSLGERQVLDKVMTELRLLCHELDIGMLVVSHLKRPKDQGHEDGARTSLSQLRGSASIGQLSDAVVGLERDQQADSDEERNTTVVRVLKNRFSGDTGVACSLRYTAETGRLEAWQGDFTPTLEGVPFA